MCLCSSSGTHHTRTHTLPVNRSDGTLLLLAVCVVVVVVVVVRHYYYSRHQRLAAASCDQLTNASFGGEEAGHPEGGV